eukprot:6482762-Amphidinium_carterae.1
MVGLTGPSQNRLPNGSDLWVCSKKSQSRGCYGCRLAQCEPSISANVLFDLRTVCFLPGGVRAKFVTSAIPPRFGSTDDFEEFVRHSLNHYVRLVQSINLNNRGSSPLGLAGTRWLWGFNLLFTDEAPCYWFPCRRYTIAHFYERSTDPEPACTLKFEHVRKSSSGCLGRLAWMAL